MPIHKKVKGTILLTEDYQMIYPQIDDNTLRTDRWTEGDIYLHELTAGDQIYVKFWKYDETGEEHRGYHVEIINGDQGEITAIHIGAIIESWFKVEVKQTLAPESFKNINFKFYEVTD